MVDPAVLSGALAAVTVAVMVAGCHHRKVGGIHFVKLGHLGMSFWVSKRKEVSHDFD